MRKQKKTLAFWIIVALAPVYELFREKCMQAAPIAGLNDLRLYTTTQALR
jgi:hypothetical protein